MAITLPKKQTTQPHTKPKDSGNAGAGGGENQVRYLTIRETAEILKVSIKTVRRLLAKKKIPVARVGQQVRIPEHHLSLLVTHEWKA